MRMYSTEGGKEKEAGLTDWLGMKRGEERRGEFNELTRGEVTLMKGGGKERGR